MNSEAFPKVTSADQEYAQLWCESSAKVLESLHGTAFAATCRPVVAQSDLSDDGGGLSILFKVFGRLEGEQCLQVTRPDAVRLAQLLMSEPMDASVSFAETHTDALHEICRQFAGLAATSCKAKYGSEVQFQLDASASAQWKPAAYIVGVFAAPQVNPIQWTLSISPELHAVLGVLEAARTAPTAPPLPTPAPSDPVAQGHTQPSAAPSANSVRAPQPPAASPKPSPLSPASATVSAGTPANLNLLLDIELDASLRFGRRDMMLRDILNLRPGSVIELDRQIQEPAELLVAGRVVARGEVVIVDGSYGLRISEIERPQQRLLSVET